MENQSGRKRRARWLVVVAFVTAAAVAAVALALIATHRSPAGTTTGASYHGPMAQITLHSAQVVEVPNAGVTAAGIGRASETFRITPSGSLARSEVLTIPLVRTEPSNGLVLVFTSESAGGPWTPLATTLIRGGRYASVRVSRLSFFEAVKISWQAAMTDLESFFAGFTGGAFSNASEPLCARRAVARSGGYSASATAGDTVLWCFGLENGQRELKVVDNRRYPLLITHGMPLIAGTSSTDVFQLAARELSPGGAVVFPGYEDDFSADSIPVGHWAGIHADLSPEGQLLSSLEVGVSALFSIITRFGAGDDPTKIMKVVDKLLTINACRAALGSVGAMVSSCLSPDQIAKAFGVPWGVVLAPLAAVSGLIAYFRGSLNGIFDQFNSRSQFTIVIKHVTPYTAFAQQWGVHDGTLCIGEALDTSPQALNGGPPCSGSGTVGWERGWMGCGSINGQVPVCNEWWRLSFSYDQSSGTVLATVVGNPIATTFNGQLIPGLHGPVPIPGERGHLSSQ